MITAYYVNVKDGITKPIELNTTLEQYDKLLDCRMIDIVERTIEGRWFDFIVDDEGLLKNDPIVSVIDTEGQPMLIGNVIIVHHDGEGNEATITQDDVKLIEKHLMPVIDLRHGRAYKLLGGVDYE